MAEAHYLANKSLYNRWFPEGIFPVNYFHKIDGELLDINFERLTNVRLDEIAMELPYPVIMKPSLNSWGGNAIRFIENRKQLLANIGEMKDFVVQEKVDQHEIQKRLHPKSVNTVRVYLYKSVKNDSVHIINISQRMGNGGMLDNVASGGLVSLIGDDGRMHGYALDRFGEKFFKHPVTDVPFTSALPEFEMMKQFAIEIASKLFYWSQRRVKTLHSQCRTLVLR